MESDNPSQESIKNAVDSDDIREQMKRITLTALSQQQLDKEGIKSVLHTVLKGVTDGLGESGTKMKPKLEQSLAGIDDALSKSAIAAKLAAEEAMGKAENFAKTDLKNAMGELEKLEDLFIDTINTVASQSNQVVAGTLRELSGHFKATGTSSGREALDAINKLKSTMLEAGKDSVDEVTQAGKTMGNHFIQMTSGILAGMAEALKSKSK